MSGSLPVDIRTLTQGPGRDWTADQHARVKAWLSEPSQTKALAGVGETILRSSVDAEEAWDDFRGKPREHASSGHASDWVWPLDGVLATFDPGVAPFWPYLVFCFARYCRKRKLLRSSPDGEPIRSVKPNQPLGDVQIAGTEPAAWQVVHGTEILAGIDDCARQLPEGMRHVFVAHYLEEQTHKEVAARIGVSEAAVRVSLHRARRRVRDCLRAKGFKP
jgi:RNA polymerase sigma factor (sigma-70 family)